MLSNDSIIEDCIMLFDYCTKSCGYNMFIIDEVDSNKVKLLRKYIEENNNDVSSDPVDEEIEKLISIMGEEIIKYN